MSSVDGLITTGNTNLDAGKYVHTVRGLSPSFVISDASPPDVSWPSWPVE